MVRTAETHTTFHQAKGIFTGALSIAAAIPKCVGTRKQDSGAIFQEG
jgi:hypothetical protein